MSSNFPQVNHAIAEDIKKELRLQGHYLTGTLENSITEIITTGENGLTLAASAAGYIESLEHPTPASQINLTTAEYRGLIKWVMLRGLATSEGPASRIASAIVAKWKKEGRPTEGSKEFSKTGKRIEAIADTFQKNDSRYTGMIDKEVIGGLDDEFNTIKSGTV
jgi:hypothetical protein